MRKNKNPENNPAHEPRRSFVAKKGWLASILSPNSKDARLDKQSAELEKYYQESYRRRLDATPAGPGLKGYDLDMNQFQYSTDMSELTGIAPAFSKTFAAMSEKLSKNASVHEDETANIYVKLMHSSAALSRPTNELREWLEQNTPQNGYFTPEMVLAAVADDERVVTTSSHEDNLLSWKFSDSEGNSFALSRTADGSRPTVPTRPYLAAHYWNDYDADSQSVVSTPRLSLNHTSQKEYRTLKDSPLASAIRENLHLVPVRVDQEIDFRVVESKPRPYFTDASTESLESIRAEAHIIADLPQHRA